MCKDIAVQEVNFIQVDFSIIKFKLFIEYNKLMRKFHQFSITFSALGQYYTPTIVKKYINIESY